MKKSLAIALCLPFVLWTCQHVQQEGKDAVAAQGEEFVSEATPKPGRSELALTMREMYDQMKLVADSLSKGLPVKTNYLERYNSIHTDQATEPEKIDETYQAMASAFLMQYEAFEISSDNKAEKFNGMVNACLACHQQKCPGPMEAIETLKLE